MLAFSALKFAISVHIINFYLNNLTGLVSHKDLKRELLPLTQ